MILEVMGRHAGWIALHCGVSGGADVILIPEIPFSMERVAQKVRDREECDAQFSIIVAAEGAREVEGDKIYQDAGDCGAAPRLGGIGHHVAHELMRLTDKEARCVVLGHLQRGGSPNAFDRMLATNFGSAAVRALARGKRGVMVSLQAANIRTVPLADAIANLKTVPPESQLVRTARDVGVSFGALDEERFHHGEGCDQ
jgi:6-phosphofructokinase 1